MARVHTVLRRSSPEVAAARARPRHDRLPGDDGAAAAATSCTSRIASSSCSSTWPSGRGASCSRHELLREVWGYPDMPATRLVDNAVARLRKKIEPDPGNPRFVHTVRGDGYTITPEGWRQAPRYPKLGQARARPVSYTRFAAAPRAAPLERPCAAEGLPPRKRGGDRCTRHESDVAADRSGRDPAGARPARRCPPSASSTRRSAPGPWSRRRIRWPTQAGIDILKKGGNAFDAAVAVAATLNVVEPSRSGMGGVGFMTLYVAKTGEVVSLQMTGAAPYAATPDRFKSKRDQEAGYLAGVVPGQLRRLDLPAREVRHAAALGRVRRRHRLRRPGVPGRQLPRRDPRRLAVEPRDLPDDGGRSSCPAARCRRPASGWSRRTSRRRSGASSPWRPARARPARRAARR